MVYPGLAQEVKNTIRIELETGLDAQIIENANYVYI